MIKRIRVYREIPEESNRIIKVKLTQRGCQQKNQSLGDTTGVNGGAIGLALSMLELDTLDVGIKN